MMLRWQGVQPAADPATFIRDVRVIAIDAVGGELPASVPRIDIAGRRRQLLARAAHHALRTRAPDWMV